MKWESGSLIEFLLKRLSEEIAQDVFIVVDGLDEVGYEVIGTDRPKARNEKERSDVSEREEFLDNLGKVDHPKPNLPFISRPEVKVDNHIADSVVWNLDYKANEDDIGRYVKSKLEARGGEMQRKFDITEVKPYEYFRKYSGGIFLWVWTVVNEIEKLNMKQDISARLENFRKASGKMEELYCDILSRISDHNRALVREILKWLLVSTRQFAISQLQGAVEAGLKQQFFDFPKFLKSECASLVRVSPTGGVDLIHETLLSVLVDSHLCPVSFKMDIAELNREAASTCLEVLCVRVM